MNFTPSRLATAQWADSEWVAQKHHFQNGTFWLGHNDDSTPLGYQDDRHICLVSGSRGGKGTSVIVNNLCLWPGSAVVIDPKGENATITAARRGNGLPDCKGMGQDVYVLDPFETAHGTDALRGRFNPLDALDSDDEESIDEAALLADALVIVNPESKDPFWDESARSMVKGLILHVLTASEFAGRRTLATIRDLITRGDFQSVELLRAAGETDIASGQALLWEGVRNNLAFGGVIAGIGESFANMVANSPKQFESVRQVADRNTEFIDSPGMRKCLSTSDFKLSDLKTKECGVSLYLCLPQRYMNTHYRWLRMMIALTVIEMEKVKGRPATGHRVLMCLDEFAGLKRMGVIENAVAQIAGFGVTLFFVLQSLEQLKATYKDNWETFLANSGLKIFFNLEDHFSREYVSKLVGETEVVREVRSASQSQSESQSRTHGQSTSVTSSTAQTRSHSGGASRSANRSTGAADGMSWKQNFLLFRSDKYNAGSNRSEGISDGTNSGWSHGTTQGSSSTSSTTTSTTYATSHSTTNGTSETVHRRPLVSPDELGKVFGRISDDTHPAYPGLALVLASGENPIPVRRSNYFEDAFFYQLFTPHPDYTRHAFQILIPVPVSQIARLNLLVKTGDAVKTGQPIYHFQPSVSGLTDKPLALLSPVSGVVKRLREGNEIVMETDCPVLDGDIEKKNRDAVGDLVRKIHWVDMESTENTIKASGGLILILITSCFFVPTGFAKFFLSFALLTIGYIFLRWRGSKARILHENEIILQK